MRSLRTLVALGAAALGLGASAAPALAQKALVYCPVADVAGCTTLATSLAPAFPGGVDKGFDGSNGTVDLASADLSGYALFVVPSLADNATAKPYARLRETAVKERLRGGLTGRIALWSGTPDLGSTNRAAKDSLVRSVARWTSADFATAKGPGLLVLLDQSETASARYDWVNGLTGMTITADAAFKSYASVRATSATGTAIVGGVPAYSNMATYGFYLPSGAAGLSLDAVGQTGTTEGGQVVLATAPSGSRGAAVIKTDKDDYVPGETVVMTGFGFAAGEKVTLKLHEDPLVHEDRTFEVTADANGDFTYTGFKPEPHDVGIRFILTAAGQTSARFAQTTFTDGNSTIIGRVTDAVTGVAISGATVTCDAANGCNGPKTTTTAADGKYALTVEYAGNTASLSLTVSKSGYTTQTTTPTFCVATSAQHSTADCPTTVTQNVALVPSTTSTTTSVSSSANPSEFGQSVIFTATVTPASGSIGSVGTVTFKNGATDICANVAVSGGQASCVTSALAVNTTGHSVTAVYSGGTGYSGSTSAALTQVVNRRSVTVTADAKSKIYGDADPVLTYQVTSGTLLAGDSFTGSLARVAGEAVNTYAIQQGTLALNANYAMTFVSANFTITGRPITVTADAKTKGYGDGDPALTYKVTSGALQGSDAFTGSLTRAPGEAVGIYAITQGSLSAGTNYAITFVGANLTIGARAITVTADAKSKSYGDADPALTYQVTSGSLAAGDAFTGALARAAGENVGTYAIQQGTLALSANYTLTFIGADLTIAVRAVTITADAKSKMYGQADPALTYQITSGALKSGDSFTGSLARAAGEDVGTYAIQQGSVALNGNYTLTFVSANLTITKRAITVTVDAKSKAYGDADPALTYQVTNGSLFGEDVFSGALSRVAGEDVGAYAIQQGTLSAGRNYELTFVGASLTITKRAVTVTADAQSKTYGDADPTPLTFKLTSGSLKSSDSFSGALTRDAGENVGEYAIKQGTLALNDNYAVTFVGAKLTIGKKAASVTPNAASKTYGDADPALTGTLSGFIAADGVAASYSRTAGEAAGGSYTISATLSPEAKLGNYNVTYNTAVFTITKRAVTATADAQSKTYGEADPALTYAVNPSLVGDDKFAGALTRAAGETVGQYHIQQGTLALSDNYTLTFVGAKLTINKKAASVTPAANTKVYGETDPTLSGALSGFLAADGVTAAYARAPGETVESYTISATLAPTTGVLGNYEITYNTAQFTITARPVTVKAVSLSKTYGEATPAYVIELAGGSSLGSGDQITALGTPLFTTDPATPVNVGTYPIAVSGLANGNYTIGYATGDAMGALTINQRSITVTADAKSMTYGDADPVLTHQVTTGSLASGDTFAGALTRDPGENVGQYAIQRGTLALSSNYALTFVGAKVTIVARAITVTADAQSKLYGTADPTPLSYKITSGTLVGSDAFAGALERELGEAEGQYEIRQATLALSTNYALTYMGAKLTITNGAPVITAFTGTTDPVAVGAKATVSGAFSDLGFPTDTYTITVTWKNGSAGTPISSAVSYTYDDNTDRGTFSSEPTNLLPGVYTVTAVVADKFGLKDDSTHQYVVVYDPSGGFVTGGGWIDSPAGASVEYPTALGRANFGFNSKYLKGAKVPTGNTEFQFKAGNLDFKSKDYEWLVVSGARAQYKGTGTINGNGSYGFLLTSIDGQVSGGGGADKFRIKIWDLSTNKIVYDNQMESDDDASLNAGTVIRGGSIVIHNK